MKNFKLMMLITLSLSLIGQAMDESAIGITQEQANRMLFDARTAEQVQAALDAGADVNTCNVIHGMTPLYHAVFNNNSDIVNMLLTAGADVNLQGFEGLTALTCALLSENENIAHMLLRAGANLNTEIVNINGTSITAVLIASTHPSLIQLLLGWNDEMDQMSDEDRARCVALDLETVQNTLDAIEGLRNDTTNIDAHNHAMAINPEIIQALEDYLNPGLK